MINPKGELLGVELHWNCAASEVIDQITDYKLERFENSIKLMVDGLLLDEYKDTIWCDSMVNFINKLVLDAVVHGGNLDGVYRSNHHELYKTLMEFIRNSGIQDAFDVREIPVNYNGKKFKELQIVRTKNAE